MFHVGTEWNREKEEKRETHLSTVEKRERNHEKERESKEGPVQDSLDFGPENAWYAVPSPVPLRTTLSLLCVFHLRRRAHALQCEGECMIYPEYVMELRMKRALSAPVSIQG